MRTLNRPMFRYGGPIKEGVMNGIREPKRNGGAMGTRQAALVGNPNFPMQDGRALHSEAATRSALEKIKQAFAATAGSPKNVVKSLNPGKKIAMAKNAGLALLNPLKNFYKNYRSKLDMPPKFKSAGGEFKGAGTAGGGSLPMSLLERAKYFATKNPKTTAAGVGVGASSGLLEGVVGGVGKGIKNTGLQIADLLVSDKYFDQDKYFADKEKAKLAAENTTTLNTDLKKLLEQPATPKKSEKELRAEQISKYRDIVDIKGMNKNATYDALIAASQAVLGDGDFKGSLKDGSLINKIIGSTSKAFDKPKATKDAIDTLILKGEIEKDMNKDKNAIMDAYRMKQIALADKQLSGGGFSENKGVLAKTMSGQTLFDTAAAKSSPNFMGNLMTKKSLTDLMTEAKKKGDIVERDIIITTTEELIKGKGVPNGDYTVGDVLVTIVNGKVANVTR